MRVHVLGFYDMNNVGDEAFRPAIQRIFYDHDVEFFNIDIYRAKQPETPDLLVLGGGDVVTPYYLPVVSAIPCRKIALGVGFGYESESKLAGDAHLDAWFLRNQSDVELLARQTTVPVHFTPDLAFDLAPSGNKVLHRYYNGNAPVAAICLTDYLLPSLERMDDLFWNRSKSFVKHFGPFCEWLGKQGYQVLTLPCSTDFHADDRRVHLWVRAFADFKMICVQDYLQPQDMVDLLAECQVSVCQRFHSHVFSLLAGVPIMSVGFTRKVKELLGAVGAGVDANCFSGGEYVERDFPELFQRVKKEADWMSARFLGFAKQKRDELAVVKQTVRQLTIAA